MTFWWLFSTIFYNRLNFYSTDLPKYASKIADKEPLLIVDEILPEFIGALERLQQRLKEPVKKKFYHFKTLKTHILPLTNVAFDKAGIRFGGSLDRFNYLCEISLTYLNRMYLLGVWREAMIELLEYGTLKTATNCMCCEAIRMRFFLLNTIIRNGSPHFHFVRGRYAQSLIVVYVYRFQW